MDLKQRLEKQQQYFFDVIADPHCNFGLNPSWARLYPYQLLAKPSERAGLHLQVREMPACADNKGTRRPITGIAWRWGWENQKLMVITSISPTTAARAVNLDGGDI